MTRADLAADDDGKAPRPWSIREPVLSESERRAADRSRIDCSKWSAEKRLAPPQGGTESK